MTAIPLGTREDAEARQRSNSATGPISNQNKAASQANGTIALGQQQSYNF